MSSLIRSDVLINEINQDADPSCGEGGSCTLSGGYFVANGTAHKGYVWFRRKGNQTINGTANLAGRKVVLLVEGGDLTISGRVSITAGSGFFGAFVGKGEGGAGGNIIVDPSVSHPTQASLEGIFLSDGGARRRAILNQS